MAERDCLRALLDGAARAPRAPSVVSSVVRWTDGRLHPMNNPWLRLHHRAEFAEGAGAGLAAIRASTFVSTLVHRRAIAAHGIPPAPFFVWLADMDYTAPILRDVAGSRVPYTLPCHKT